MSPGNPEENFVEREKIPEQRRLTIEVFPDEELSIAVAKRLLERITQSTGELKIGISQSQTLNQVMDSFVDLIRQKIGGGEAINLSRIEFIQMEALFPESKDSSVNRFAYTIETRLIQPLRDLGLTVNIYYPGVGHETLEDAVAEFEERVSDLDIDLVSVNASGDTRAYRDADVDPITGRPRYVAGKESNRDITVRLFKESDFDPQTAQLGDKVFTRPDGDVPSQILFKKLEKNIDEDIATGNTETKRSIALLTEGIRTLLRADEVWFVTSGTDKKTAVERAFRDTYIRGMTDEERRKRYEASRARGGEGRTTTAATIEGREMEARRTNGNKQTIFFCDNSAAGESNFGNLGELGNTDIIRHD